MMHPLQSNYNDTYHNQIFVPADPNLTKINEFDQKKSFLTGRKGGHRREHSAGLDVLSAAAAVGLSNEELASAAGAPAYLTSRKFHRRGNSNLSVSSLDIQMNFIDEDLPRVPHVAFISPNYTYPYFPGAKNRRMLPTCFNYSEPYLTQQVQHPYYASASFENSNVDGPGKSQIKYPYPMGTEWEAPGKDVPVSVVAEKKKGHHRKLSSFSSAISTFPLNIPYPRHKKQTSHDLL